jgi:hypothetical protein
LAEHEVFDPAKVLLTGFAVGPEQEAMAVGPVEGQQVDEFLPSGGLTPLFDGQDVFPTEQAALSHNRLAAVEGIGDEADGQFGELFFEPSAEAQEAL